MFDLATTLRVVTQLVPLRGKYRFDRCAIHAAERPEVRSHAERGNESIPKRSLGTRAISLNRLALAARCVTLVACLMKCNLRCPLACRWL